MSFYAFALGVAAVFFVSSLIMLNWGRYIGLQSLEHQHPDDIAALSTVENAVFALIGLLLAFTISGALQRFDERRQQIVHELELAGVRHAVKRSCRAACSILSMACRRVLKK